MHFNMIVKGGYPKKKTQDTSGVFIDEKVMEVTVVDCFLLLH